MLRRLFLFIFLSFVSSASPIEFAVANFLINPTSDTARIGFERYAKANKYAPLELTDYGVEAQSYTSGDLREVFGISGVETGRNRGLITFDFSVEIFYACLMLPAIGYRPERRRLKPFFVDFKPLMEEFIGFLQSSVLDTAAFDYRGKRYEGAAYRNLLLRDLLILSAIVVDKIGKEFCRILDSGFLFSSYLDTYYKRAGELCSYLDVIIRDRAVFDRLAAFKPSSARAIEARPEVTSPQGASSTPSSNRGTPTTSLHTRTFSGSAPIASSIPVRGGGLTGCQNPADEDRESQPGVAGRGSVKSDSGPLL